MGHVVERYSDINRKWERVTVNGHPMPDFKTEGPAYRTMKRLLRRYEQEFGRATHYKDKIFLRVQYYEDNPEFVARVRCEYVKRVINKYTKSALCEVTATAIIDGEKLCRAHAGAKLLNAAIEAGTVKEIR